jgi:hypothetical protein
MPLLTPEEWAIFHQAMGGVKYSILFKNTIPDLPPYDPTEDASKRQEILRNMCSSLRETLRKDSVLAPHQDLPHGAQSLANAHIRAHPFAEFTSEPTTPRTVWVIYVQTPEALGPNLSTYFLRFHNPSLRPATRRELVATYDAMDPKHRSRIPRIHSFGELTTNVSNPSYHQVARVEQPALTGAFGLIPCYNQDWSRKPYRPLVFTVATEEEVAHASRAKGL